MKRTEYPKVPYDECRKREKVMIGGVCLSLGLFGIQGMCTVDNTECQPYQKYLIEYRKDSP